MSSLKGPITSLPPSSVVTVSHALTHELWEECGPQLRSDRFFLWDVPNVWFQHFLSHMCSPIVNSQSFSNSRNKHCWLICSLIGRNETDPFNSSSSEQFYACKGSQTYKSRLLVHSPKVQKYWSMSWGATGAKVLNVQNSNTSIVIKVVHQSISKYINKGSESSKNCP